MVQGQEVFDAIARVREFAAKLNDVDRSLSSIYEEQHTYSDIVSKAGDYQPSPGDVPPGCTKDIDNEAFKFLRSELIPSVIKKWNNQTRTAFKSIKTQKERGEEGNKVKEVLKLIFDQAPADQTLIHSSPDNIEHISSVLDYRPVERTHPRVNGNNVEQLSLVLGDIINTQQLMSDSTTSSEEMFNKFLKDHGWIKYYQNNPEELGFKRRSKLGEKQIKEIIMDKMLEYYPYMHDEFDYKTQHKKTIEEKEGYIVQDVPGDGNCFFHAIALQTSTSQETLRSDAIQEIESNPDRYRGFIEGENIERYIAIIRRDREWADHIMIQALANQLHRNIEIVHSNAENNIAVAAIDPVQGVEPLRVLYTGNHYMSISRNSNLSHSSHLVRSEKEVISKAIKPQFIDLLSTDLTAKKENYYIV